MRLFQNSPYSFFFNKSFDFYNVSKGSPSMFLIFCNKLYFQKVERDPPFTILKPLRFLSLRYSSDFSRSRLVHHNHTMTSYDPPFPSVGVNLGAWRTRRRAQEGEHFVSQVFIKSRSSSVYSSRAGMDNNCLCIRV